MYIPLASNRIDRLIQVRRTQAPKLSNQQKIATPPNCQKQEIALQQIQIGMFCDSFFRQIKRIELRAHNS